MWLQGRRFAPVTISSRQMMQTLSMDCSSSGVASGYLWGYSGVRRQNPPKPAPKSHRDNERTPLRPPPLASIHHLLAQNPLLRGYPQPVSPQGRPNPFFRAKLSRSPPNLDQTHLELDPTPHKSPTKPADVPSSLHPSIFLALNSTSCQTSGYQQPFSLRHGINPTPF